MIQNKWKGRFIDVEGLDGSGKTSALKLLADQISAKKYSFIKGVGSNGLWGYLAKKYATTWLFAWEVLLVSLFQIQPALKAGRIVITDKYFFAVASHIPHVEKKINRWILKFIRRLIIQPDLIVYLEVELDERLARLKKEAENKFHQMLINDPVWLVQREKAYRQVVDSSRARIVHLDNTNFTVRKTAKKLKIIIENFLQKEAVWKK